MASKDIPSFWMSLTPSNATIPAGSISGSTMHTPESVTAPDPSDRSNSNVPASKRVVSPKGIVALMYCI